MGEDVYSFDMSLPEIGNPEIHYIEGDFFDDYTLKKIIEGMDVIFHAICTLNPGNSNEKCILGYERDFVQTAKLCSFIKDTECRMIFFSSTCVIKSLDFPANNPLTVSNAFESFSSLVSIRNTTLFTLVSI